jgi:hypothetical protein
VRSTSIAVDSKPTTWPSRSTAASCDRSLPPATTPKH